MKDRRLSSTTPKFRSQRQAGVSLVEVLVAVLILSLGLLGMAGMQARAVKANQSAQSRTQAVMLSYYILDAMRADATQATDQKYNTGSGGNKKECDPTNFTGTALADVTRKAWLESLHETLGETKNAENKYTTCGEIECESGATGVCTVKIYWDDSLSGGLANQVFTTTSQL